MLGAWPLHLARRGVPSLLGAAVASTRLRAAPHASLVTGAAASFDMAAEEEEDVLVEMQPGCFRTAVMNRPKALNAVNLSMVKRLTELYDTCVPRSALCAAPRPRRGAHPNAPPPAPRRSWESKAHVRAVMLKGAGGRAFCAGGDVRALAGSQLDKPERVAAAIEYFRAEDSLVYKIANLSKPHVAVLDGIVMVRRASALRRCAQPSP